VIFVELQSLRASQVRIKQVDSFELLYEMGYLPRWGFARKRFATAAFVGAHR